jgi:Ni,Fe-hydrogenase III component G
MDTEEIFETARLLVEEWAEKIETPAPNRMDIYMKSKEDLIAAVAGLRVKRLGYLAGITGLDPGVECEHFEVLYHFCPGPAILNLRVQVPKNSSTIASLCAIIPSAESFERELMEMFGIQVTGLRTPEKLYLPEDWPDGVFPLRKEYNSQALIDQVHNR